MLTVKCAGCKTKLFKYRKIGPGQVLRCHKNRITRDFEYQITGGELRCLCGQCIGIDMGSHFKMKADKFTSTGTKDTK